MPKNSNDKKTATLVARCTKDEKEKILKKAKDTNKSESRYIIDSCLSGTERKTDKLKKMQIQQVQIQEELNQLSYLLERYEESLPSDYLEHCKLQMEKLRGVSKCQF